jgi:hypothetical protein
VRLEIIGGDYANRIHHVGHPDVGLYAACNGCKQIRGWVGWLDKARAKHPTAHLRYRLIQSEKCWYDPVSLAKAGHKTRVAGEGAVPSTLAAGSLGATPSESVRGQPATRTYDNDDLNEIFTVLCGGPCPQLANPPGYLLRKK